jgi:hypothetical protein
VGAARDFKIQPITAQVRNPAEIESTIAKLGSQPSTTLADFRCNGRFWIPKSGLQ